MKLVEIISMIQGLIDKINARTGKTDTTLAEAVNRVTSENMVDTSDATMEAGILLDGYTGYAKGEKVTGNLEYTQRGYIRYYSETDGDDTTATIINRNNIDYLRFKNKFKTSRAFLSGASIGIDLPLSDFGDASPDDVIAGKTFTSSAGIKKTGTSERILKKTGTTEIAGDTKSFKIDTGLTTIDAIIVYKTSSSNSTFFWVYSGIVKALAYANTSNKLLSTSTTFYTSGGTITCNANLEQYPIKAGTYKWVAYGS